MTGSISGAHAICDMSSPSFDEENKVLEIPVFRQMGKVCCAYLTTICCAFSAPFFFSIHLFFLITYFAAGFSGGEEEGRMIWVGKHPIKVGACPRLF